MVAGIEAVDRGDATRGRVGGALGSGVRAPRADDSDREPNVGAEELMSPGVLTTTAGAVDGRCLLRRDWEGVSAVGSAKFMGYLKAGV